MSVGYQVSSDHQLVRLLRIGIVLKEVVEARAYHRHEEFDEDALDRETRALLSHTVEESADYRERLEAVIGRLAVDGVPFEGIGAPAETRYDQTKPEDLDGVLYDQLCNGETAYKFYDDVIEAIEASETQFSIGHEELVTALLVVRDEEAEGVEEVARIMEDRE